jgi:protein-S-isoprenylcysteine O-methyltransferase Ste14
VSRSLNIPPKKNNLPLHLERLARPLDFGKMNRFSSYRIAIVVVAWLTLALTMLLRRQDSRKPDRRRLPQSLAGLALQGLGFALLFSFQSGSFFSPLRPPVWVLELIWSSGVLVLVISVFLMESSLRALGEQWSLIARILEKHQLIMRGPYRFLRHPIYAAMLGMMLGSSFLVSHWTALGAGVFFYGMGTRIRIRLEERLLRDAFGQEYADYIRSVPAIFPRWIRFSKKR